MNSCETWFCGSPYWRWITRRKLLPWIVQGSELGDHILELGAGPGVATQELALRAPRVTSLEYDHPFAAKLAAQVNGPKTPGIWGESSTRPLTDARFSFGIHILLFHHV